MAKFDSGLALENSRLFVTPPLRALRNDVWETSVEILYSMMRHYPDLGYADLIGWKLASSNQKHYQDLKSDASSVWDFCSRFLDVISRRN